MSLYFHNIPWFTEGTLISLLLINWSSLFFDWVGGGGTKGLHYINGGFGLPKHQNEDSKKSGCFSLEFISDYFHLKLFLLFLWFVTRVVWCKWNSLYITLCTDLEGCWRCKTWMSFCGILGNKADGRIFLRYCYLNTATLGFNMLTIAALHGFILRNFFCFNHSDSHVSCMYTCFHMTNFTMLLTCHLFVSWFSLFSCTLNHNFSLVQLLSRWNTFFYHFCHILIFDSSMIWFQ